MIYTTKIQKAIEIALKAHAAQERKTRNIPYIFHPLTVALILARIGADEDVIVAGILHDVIEDSYGSRKITLKNIEEEFGKHVAKIVENVTEKNKSLPWRKRKELARKHILKMDKDSLLLKTADVLHNISEKIIVYKNIGEKMFDFFNAPKKQQIDHYEKIITNLKKSWRNNPILNELELSFLKLKKMANE